MELCTTQDAARSLKELHDLLARAASLALEAAVLVLEHGQAAPSHDGH